MKIIFFITNPHTARQILAHLKFSTNPFDPLPYDESLHPCIDIFPFDPGPDYTKGDPEPDYNRCDLQPGTPDGFPDPYEEPIVQYPLNTVIRWRDHSQTDKASVLMAPDTYDEPF